MMSFSSSLLERWDVHSIYLHESSSSLLVSCLIKSKDILAHFGDDQLMLPNMLTSSDREDIATPRDHHVPLPEQCDQTFACFDDFPLEECETSRGSQQQLGLKPLDFLTADMFQTRIPMLHSAAREGKVEAMKEIVSNCPESVMERQVPSNETPLHVAVRYSRLKAIKFLVEWLRESPYFSEVVNGKDSSGVTALHLATSRKQFQTLKLLLDCNLAYGDKVEVNTMNNHGLTALDFCHVQPEGGKIDMEIEKLLRRAGGLRGRDLVQQMQENRKNEVAIKLGHRFCGPSPPKVIRSDSFTISCHTTLLLATLFAGITYHAALRPVGLSSGLQSYDSSRVRSQEATTYHLLVLFNSVAFFTSIGMIAIILHDLPLFPWPQVSISSSIAAYVCAVMANSAQEVPTVIMVGSSVMLVAILKCLALDKMVLNIVHCLLVRCRKI